MGLEPTPRCLTDTRSAAELPTLTSECPVGVEPTSPGWKPGTFAVRPRAHVTSRRKERESNPQGCQARPGSSGVPSPVGLPFRKAAAAGIEPASGRLTAAYPYQHGTHRIRENSWMCQLSSCRNVPVWYPVNSGLRIVRSVLCIVGAVASACFGVQSIFRSFCVRIEEHMMDAINTLFGAALRVSLLRWSGLTGSEVARLRNTRRCQDCVR